MIPGPGTECALVKSDHEAILCVPEEYCRETVLPLYVLASMYPSDDDDSWKIKNILTDIRKLAIFENHKIKLL